MQDKKSGRGSRLIFREVATAALSGLDQTLGLLGLSGGKRQGQEYLVRNPTRADDSIGSFSIRIRGNRAGTWADFATGDKGRDLLDLAAYVWGVPVPEAAERLAAALGIGGDGPTRAASQRRAAETPWRALTCVPADAIDAPAAHPRHSKPSQRWAYRDAEGRLMGYVDRFDPPGGRKQFRPLTYCEGPAGRREWRWEAWEAPRPLYRLDRLAANPDAGVVMTEGEKACDAASALFPGRVCVTWPHGAKAVDKADFSVLAGRSVLLWPDNDAPGREAMTAVRLALEAVGAVDVRTIAPGAFARGADPLPEGFDAADALAQGLTPGDVERLAAGGGFLIAEPEPELAPEPALEPEGGADGGQAKPSKGKRGINPAMGKRFTWDSDGALWCSDGPKNDCKVSPPFEFPALARLSDSTQWAYVMEFRDLGGIKHREVIPLDWLHGEAREVTKKLQALGFLFPHKCEYLWLIYVRSEEALDGLKRARLVQKTGWHQGPRGEAFVLPDLTVGDCGEELIYAPPGASETLSRFGTAGTPEGWREGVAALAVGNSRLSFAISLAFAAPMAWLCGVEGGGIHLLGATSTGKTSLLVAAASVCGEPVPGGFLQSWRTTDSAAELTAAAHNDALLPLDEIGQIDPRIIGEMLYQLGNGGGKSRMARAGGFRDRLTWRTLYLSTGEKSLSQLCAEAGTRLLGGVEMRLLEIPAEVERGTVFDQLHGRKNGAALADDLRAAAARDYGHPFRGFLARLTEPSGTASAREYFAAAGAALEAALGDHASGEARRGVRRFALIAAGGELASAWGLTGWREGEATRAAVECFKVWRDYRGGYGSSDDERAIEQVCTFLQANYQGRCSLWLRPQAHDSHAPARGQRLGVVRYTEPTFDGAGEEKKAELDRIFILAGQFVSELCEGLDHRKVAKLLAERGIIERFREGNEWRLAQKVSLPGEGRARCYVFTPKFLSYAADDEGASDAQAESEATA